MSKTEQQLVEALKQLARAVDDNTVATRLLAGAMAPQEPVQRGFDGNREDFEDRVITDPEAEAQPEM